MRHVAKGSIETDTLCFIVLFTSWWGRVWGWTEEKEKEEKEQWYSIIPLGSVFRKNHLTLYTFIRKHHCILSWVWLWSCFMINDNSCKWWKISYMNLKNLNFSTMLSQYIQLYIIDYKHHEGSFTLNCLMGQVVFLVFMYTVDFESSVGH